MPKLTVDGTEIEVEDGLTVMQACEQAGVEIPHFCFHERLKIAGNCRMCLVDIEKSPKLVASCAMPASEGMVIITNSPKVQKAREGVMEFLLINHPLDCPICDQGGECDLQDQAFKYGKGNSRYEEEKRAVTEKNLGPLIKTNMTRCIHCTRCVRFSTDVAGVPEMGAIGRGEHMEITSYLEQTLTSELSGNIIDLCPVGALTSKPYAFTARSWELETTESIDVMDALGSNICINSRGMQVMRVLPKNNDDINEEWISDKARFSYDGLRNQRLDRPYVRENGKLQEASWDQALEAVANKISSLPDKSAIAAIAGTTVPCESMFLLKRLLGNLGSNLCDANQFGYKFDLSARGNYLFNTTISGIDRADFCLLIGANPRKAAPVLNARIGRMVRENSLAVARIGEADDQTYPIIELGEDVSVLELLQNPEKIKENEKLVKIAAMLSAAKKPMVIIGDAVLVRSDSLQIIYNVHKLAQKYQMITPNWNGFNILHNHASMVGALDLGFINGSSGNGTHDILANTQNGQVKILYLLAADEIDLSQIADDVFVIYQGHHGDASANRADVILPEAAYTEQDSMYINLEGRVQLARRAVSPPWKAKTSIEVINGLAKKLNLSVVPSGDGSLLSRVRVAMAEENDVFAAIDRIIPAKFNEVSGDGKLLPNPLKKVATNYYMSDAITRASATMAKCTKMQITVQ